MFYRLPIQEKNTSIIFVIFILLHVLEMFKKTCFKKLLMKVNGISILICTIYINVLKKTYLYRIFLLKFMFLFFFLLYIHIHQF